MKLRTNNRFRGITKGATNRKLKYQGHQYARIPGRSIRMLSPAEIAEFQQCVQRAITGDVPRAKPL